MTGKIKLTQEQADFIEKGFEAGMEAEEMINRFANAGSFVKQPSHKLYGLCVADLAKALLIGYEIGPEPLKIGGWATNHIGDGFRVGEIIGITNKGWFVRFLSFETNNYYTESFHPTQLEKSTPEEIAEEEERRKWAKIEEGDVLRKIPMVHEVAIYEGDADDESILVRNGSGQHLWRKSQVELYAKKVGDE